MVTKQRSKRTAKAKTSRKVRKLVRVMPKAGKKAIARIDKAAKTIKAAVKKVHPKMVGNTDLTTLSKTQLEGLITKVQNVITQKSEEAKADRYKTPEFLAIKKECKELVKQLDALREKTFEAHFNLPVTISVESVVDIHNGDEALSNPKTTITIGTKGLSKVQRDYWMDVVKDIEPCEEVYRLFPAVLKKLDELQGAADDITDVFRGIEEEDIDDIVSNADEIIEAVKKAKTLKKAEKELEEPLVLSLTIPVTIQAEVGIRSNYRVAIFVVKKFVVGTQGINRLHRELLSRGFNLSDGDSSHLPALFAHASKEITSVKTLTNRVQVLSNLLQEKHDTTFSDVVKDQEGY